MRRILVVNCSICRKQGGRTTCLSEDPTPVALYKRKQSHLALSFRRKLQIYKGDPSPLIPPRVMASSAMGHKLGVFGVFAAHTRGNKHKQNASMLFTCRAVFHACLSSRSDCNT